MSRSRSRAPLSPHVRELLEVTEASARARGAMQRSLGPAGGEARSIVAIGESVLDTVELKEQQAIAWAMALSDLVRAITKNFPENIFCDLDYVARVLAEVAEREGHVALERRIDPLVRLHRAYGRATTIRFRYVHDFLYGYDWARWVAKDPEARRGVGPFDAAFLAYSEARAEELVQAIARGDDPKYPPLSSETVGRNPFSFDRSPASEAALHQALSAEGSIPLAAWTETPSLVWDRPYAALREAKAKALGLATD